MKGIILLSCSHKVGKTYVANLLLQELIHLGANPGYFKFASCNAPSLEQSDAALIKSRLPLNQDISEMIPYLYPHNAPIHIASRESKQFIDPSLIAQRFAWNLATHSHMVVEGVGDVISPLIMEQTRVLMQEDLIRKLRLNVVLVAKVGPSALNHLSLATHYLKSTGIELRGIILNGYDQSNAMHRDTFVMIERFCQTRIIATIAVNEQAFHSRANLDDIFTIPDNYNV